MTLAFSGWWRSRGGGSLLRLVRSAAALHGNDMPFSAAVLAAANRRWLVHALKRVCLAGALLSLSGCAAMLAPKGTAEASVSSAISLDAGSALGKIALASTPSPAQSGFRLMPLGNYSLDTRLALAQRAQRSLDVQYYHVQNDETGRLFLRALRDAAVRGVRVRLLLDDLYTTGMDEMLLGLAATPNVEIRLFNLSVVPANTA
jgi:hypothetical protein